MPMAVSTPTCATLAVRAGRAASLASSTKPRAPRRTQRRGMTLIEILLVLALVVLIGGMVAPVFNGVYSTVRLRRGGDQVIAQWSAARMRAIATGEVQQFRFTPETGKLVVEPWTGVLGTGADSRRSTGAASTSSSATAAGGTTSTTTAASSTAATGTAKTTRVTLPEEVIFHAGELAVEDYQTGERSVASLQQPSEDQSTPILFFPDGTTSDASVLLTNGKQQFVRLTLRGLTGVGRASLVLTQEELQRADRRK
ncbi:pilus assembly FimT family protein [Lacipirellula sp.]|uniref:pilus assembly FimT family protein n=1 Tax=Lacipirellula sp. TaxID=2691419 RepID=UPI003D0C3717